jgi:hypothetical protein
VRFSKKGSKAVLEAFIKHEGVEAHTVSEIEGGVKHP